MPFCKIQEMEIQIPKIYSRYLCPPQRDLRFLLCNHNYVRQIKAIKARFDQLGVALTNPEIVGNNKKFAETSKEYRSLEKIVVAYDEYRKVLDDINMYKEALNGNDEELRELAKEELPAVEEKKEKLESGIRQMLIP